LPHLLYEFGGSYWIGIKAKEWVAPGKFPKRLGTRGKKENSEVEMTRLWQDRWVIAPPLAHLPTEKDSWFLVLAHVLFPLTFLQRSRFVLKKDHCQTDHIGLISMHLLLTAKISNSP
jgi:hypothetical protein